jgi:hypothetical protein
MKATSFLGASITIKERPKEKKKEREFGPPWHTKVVCPGLRSGMSLLEIKRRNW